MLYLRESLAEVASYALRGRQRVGEIGARGFEDLQFFEQEVEFLVAHCRRIEYVILVVILIEEPAELLYTVFDTVHDNITRNTTNKLATNRVPL